MQENKKRSFEKIYDKFWKELYVVAFRRLRSEEDVEDILQDIFVSLITADLVLENESSVRAYLHLRLKSRIINFYRKQLVQVTYEEHQVAIKSELSDTDSETRLMSNELEAIVLNEINRMPEKMKEIFLLSRNDLRSSEEIAAQLNLSNQTVRNQISSAIKRVRIAVNDYSKADFSPASLNIVLTIGAIMLAKY